MPINRRAVELGVIVGLVDTVIFLHFTPSIADVRSAEPFNHEVERSERAALLTTTAFTLLVAGFARSLDTFLIGGAVIVGVDFAVKHANAINPATKKLATTPNSGSLESDNLSAVPSYTETGQ